MSCVGGVLAGEKSLQRRTVIDRAAGSGTGARTRPGGLSPVKSLGPWSLRCTPLSGRTARPWSGPRGSGRDGREKSQVCHGKCAVNESSYNVIFSIIFWTDGRTDVKTVANVESPRSFKLVARVRTGPRAALVHLLRRMRVRSARAPLRPRTAPRRRSRGRAAPPPPPQPRGC